jgi:O-antigen biosynthesis protein WbqP
VKGIDMSMPQLLAETDALMLKELDIASYFRYILMTIAGSGGGDRIRTQ